MSCVDLSLGSQYLQVIVECFALSIYESFVESAWSDVGSCLVFHTMNDELLS